MRGDAEALAIARPGGADCRTGGSSILRRDVLASGLALAAPAAPAWAHPHGDGPFFLEAPLATNPLAHDFMPLPAGVTTPSTPLVTDHGLRRFSDLRGKVRIVALWAEWCPLCIVELRGLAPLSASSADARFGIVAIMTGSFDKLTLAGARALLDSHHVGDIPLWVEPDGGKTLMTAFSGTGLPCTLLVDERGRARARSRGGQMIRTTPAQAGGAGGQTRSGPDDFRSPWSDPAGAQFVAQLKAGALA